MGLVVAEGLGVDLQGIDDREHVADPGLPVQRQLIDAADGDVVADQGSDHGALRDACGWGGRIMRPSAGRRKALIQALFCPLGSCPLAGGYDINPTKAIRISAMQKFTTLEGVAAPLNMINVDTDMIIPKQYLKTIQRTGLGKALFDEMRFKTDGSEKPDFVLNKPAYRKAQILVAGENFGCGSSREHAPWALLDFGIRCVIAPSFADIFYDNCFKNGILPIKLPQAEVDKLMDDAERGANAIISIDLEKQEIRGPDGGMIKFEVDPFRKQCLLNGWDDIGLTCAPKTRSSTLRGAAAHPASPGSRQRRPEFLSVTVRGYGRAVQH